MQKCKAIQEVELSYNIQKNCSVFATHLTFGQAWQDLTTFPQIHGLGELDINV